MRWEPDTFGDEMASGDWSDLAPTQTWGGQQRVWPRESCLVRLHLVIGCLNSGLFRFLFSLNWLFPSFILLLVHQGEKNKFRYLSTRCQLSYAPEWSRVERCVCQASLQFGPLDSELASGLFFGCALYSNWLYELLE